jgi:hypothetical protein
MGNEWLCWDKMLSDEPGWPVPGKRTQKDEE